MLNSSFVVSPTPHPNNIRGRGQTEKNGVQTQEIFCWATSLSHEKTTVGPSIRCDRPTQFSWSRATRLCPRISLHPLRTVGVVRHLSGTPLGMHKLKSPELSSDLVVCVVHGPGCTRQDTTRRCPFVGCSRHSNSSHACTAM